jgi:Ca-activated chloride channel family protein
MPTRKRTPLLVLVIVLLALLALLFARCSPRREARPPAAAVSTPPVAPSVPDGSTPAPAADLLPEVLTSATLTAPAEVDAGAVFHVEWTGPDNAGDFVTIVATGAAANAFNSYAETQRGRTLELTAPMDAGPHELRYVTARSKTILGRAHLVVRPVGATLQAPGQVVLGAPVTIAWTGPSNPGDYVTIVPRSAPDAQYGNYAETAKGSPLVIAAPVEAGEAEIRYMGGERKVLARRPILIAAAAITLEAPERVVAGAPVRVAWTGPDNRGDYLTIVPVSTPDGQYGNYADTAKGSPLAVTAPIQPGRAEIRYMTGQHAKVLARRALEIVPAVVTLRAEDHAAVDALLTVEWTGPNNAGDFLTVVPKSARDGTVLQTVDAARGSPARVRTPREPGLCEIRYVTGQGHVILARRDVQVR